MQSRSAGLSLQKKGKKKKKMKKERERKSNRKMQGLYTGDQVRNHFRHASSVRGFKLSLNSFPAKTWIAHAEKNTHYFRLKLVVFLNFV